MPKVTIEHSHAGQYALVSRTENKDYIVQCDLEFPSVANHFGWQHENKEKGCKCYEHGGDGTVDCRCCGKTAIEFITDASNFLDQHIAQEVELDQHTYECYMGASQEQTL